MDIQRQPAYTRVNGISQVLEELALNPSNPSVSKPVQKKQPEPEKVKEGDEIVCLENVGIDEFLMSG